MTDLVGFAASGTATDARAPAGGPGRADGVQLIAEMRGSGPRVPPPRGGRVDDRTVQLAPLLYAVLAAVDGRRGAAAIADEVAGSTGRPVTADNVEALLGKLGPLGLLADAGGAEPELQRSNPLLALRLKVAVTAGARPRRLTQPFAALFHPLLVVPL